MSDRGERGVFSYQDRELMPLGCWESRVQRSSKLMAVCQAYDCYLRTFVTVTVSIYLANFVSRQAVMGWGHRTCWTAFFSVSDGY